MKKYLLIVAVLFGLQAQAQFLPPCDSIEVVVNSNSTTTVLMLDGIDLTGTVSNWQWDITYTSSSTTLNFTTQNITVSPIATTDSLIIFLSTFSNSPLGINCTQVFAAYYDGTNWVLDSALNFPGGGSTGTGPGGIGAMSPHCDSINIVVDPMSTTTNVVLNADASTLPGIVTSWYWDVYNYNGFIQTSSTQSVNFTASTIDTFMVFLETTIDVNGSPYICLHFGSVYYDGSTWVFTSAYLPVGPSNPGGGSTGGGGIGNTFAICDSLAIDIDPSATYANPVLNASIGNTTATVLYNDWQAFDNNGNFYSDSTLLFSFANSAPSDTFAVFVMSTVSDNGVIASCMAFDMFVFSNGGWVSMRVGGGSATGIENVNTFLSDRKLLKVVDVLGREAKEIKNTPMFYIYNDGTVEKKMIIK